MALSDGPLPEHPLKCIRVGPETPYGVEYLKKNVTENAESKQTLIKSPYGKEI